MLILKVIENPSLQVEEESVLEKLLGIESYFMKPIGETEECLTPDEIVFLAFNEEWDSHLSDCSACRTRYEAITK